MAARPFFIDACVEEEDLLAMEKMVKQEFKSLVRKAGIRMVDSGLTVCTAIGTQASYTSLRVAWTITARE